MTTIAALEGRTLSPLSDLLTSADLPDGLLDAVNGVSEALQSLMVTGASATVVEGGLRFGLTLVVPDELVLAIPGLDQVKLVIGGTRGITILPIEGEIGVDPHTSPFRIGIADVPLTLRVDGEILHPLAPGTDQPDPDAEYLDIVCGTIDLEITDRGIDLSLDAALSIPRCMVGSTGILLNVGSARWLTPTSDHLPPNTPAGFTGFAFDNVTVDLSSLGVGALGMQDAFLGTGGFSGTVDSSDPNLAWDAGASAFTGLLTTQLFGFDGGLSKVSLGFRQSALVACDVSGCIFVPYLDRVLGLELGLDGNSGFTAIAGVPTCRLSAPDDGAVAGPAGYIITADTQAFTLDVSRVEFHGGGAAAASLSLSGRAKLKVSAFELPGVEFQGLRIDTNGHVAVDGGWLDVDTAKSSALSGFPFQITKIGFGAEADGRRWIGLNGGIKLADGLPVGASVEGLRVRWTPGGSVVFSLDGVGLELSVPGTFSFAGKVAFFKTSEATGFRGTLKLSLDTLSVSVDAGLMIGRTTDGVTFFYFFLDLELPVGIPLFSTGAALYGFAGLVATNLKPARADGEDWYYGYYRRPPVGVTDPTKWGIQRGGFAIGLGTTVGTMEDTGFSFSAKVLLILVLPGPQLLLQGKGKFVDKKPDQKDPSAEGNFEALLVLDFPAKLFQANIAVAFKIASLLEVAGGLSVAFTWSDTPPPDLWHVYLGEKTPAERRIHATLFKLLQGDSWLMINRPGVWQQLPDRKGDFEIGGSIGVSFKYDFSVAKAWLDAGMIGAAAISWNPQQFTGSMELKGSAGLSALGATIVATLDAIATLKAPSPWFLTVDLEVGIKIDLIVKTFEFHTKLPFQFGDQNSPLPDPISWLATLSADHAKADEARPLDAAIVPPDVRPTVVFARPVQDRARFGSPGRDDTPPDDLGLIQVSYQLRHVVLLANDANGSHLVGAAGEATILGNTATFAGLSGAAALPDLTGTTLTLFGPGQSPAGPFTVTAGSGGSATFTGSAPSGLLSYRLSAPRLTMTVQLGAIGDGSSGESVVTLGQTLTTPDRFRGGNLVVGSVSWMVLDADTQSVRIRIDASVLPPTGAATLEGPDPSTIEAQWAPTGDPVTSSDSSTRLMVWARTPFAYFRHNESTSVQGLDAFQPGYACGPVPTEEPICTQFDDVAAGTITGTFTTAGLTAQATGPVTAVAVGASTARRLDLGTVPGGGAGKVAINFDQSADSVWVTAIAQEAGTITARQAGTVLQTVPIDHKQRRYQFTGGVDQIEITGTLVSVFQLCFMPGWTCVQFDAKTFPQGSIGTVSYAGVTVVSAGAMSVDGGVLEVEPPIVRPPISLTDRAAMLEIASGRGVGLFAAGTAPMTADYGGGAPFSKAQPTVLALNALVEPALVVIPTLGTVHLVPGVTPDSRARTARRAGGVAPALSMLTVPSVVEDTARVWVLGNKTLIATVTIVFPQPATRVRVTLGGSADVIAYAGSQEVASGSGTTGGVVSLFADPTAAAHVGWLDRVVIIAPSQARVGEVCVDAGDFGWARYEQWKWSQGVLRSVESLYESDPVLPPGSYELRVHTTAVETGARSDERPETVSATFTVGPPPGFPVATSTTSDQPTYPNGGPLTSLSTYVAKTMPAYGAPLWYRGYDTAVAFNENYVTRLYLDAGYELRVFVVNASGVAIRSAARQIWSGTDASLDAWTDEYVRTLNGDGTDPCAQVDLSKIVRQELVTAGGGEPLEPSRLHASELRTSATPPTVLHRFEFTTSAYVSLRHHLGVFDGRCRRLDPDANAPPASSPPRVLADAAIGRQSAMANAVAAARTAWTKANTGTATDADRDAVVSALATLSLIRADAQTQAAMAFDVIWQACFGDQNPGALPSQLRVSVVRAQASPAVDVFLLESPEPIAWDRVSVTAATVAAPPMRQHSIMIAADFGRPDAGLDVAYGGLQWQPAVELWVVDGVLRARADQPLDVTIVLDNVTTIELDLVVDAGSQATVTTTPALPTGDVVVAGPSTSPVIVAAPAGVFTAVWIVGSGVGLSACRITGPFVPAVPSSPLRITDIFLPTAAQPIDHEITLLATDGGTFDGYTIRWIDAVNPGASQLYAVLNTVTLLAGQRIRLIPGRASAPVTDDALVQAGGPGTPPPVTGAVYQLVDPSGVVIHERAAVPVVQVQPAAATLAAIANADGSRAFLVPPPLAQAIGSGYWEIGWQHVGDAGPDLDVWSVGGAPVTEKARLSLVVL
jgi:hypothetical protein